MISSCSVELVFMPIRLVKLYMLWIDGVFRVLNDLFDGNVEDTGLAGIEG
jgi:hypothetical protein